MAGVTKVALHIVLANLLAVQHVCCSMVGNSTALSNSIQLEACSLSASMEGGKFDRQQIQLYAPAVTS